MWSIKNHVLCCWWTELYVLCCSCRGLCNLGVCSSIFCFPFSADPFADANADNSGAGSKEYVHIRIQQRNGRKSLTTVQGLKKEFSYNKILKDLKKEFCCNGTVVQDPELGQVIQLQGDQRKNVSTFLVQAGIVKKEHIKIHGFWFWCRVKKNYRSLCYMQSAQQTIRFYDFMVCNLNLVTNSV